MKTDKVQTACLYIIQKNAFLTVLGLTSSNFVNNPSDKLSNLNVKYKIRNTEYEKKVVRSKSSGKVNKISTIRIKGISIQSTGIYRNIRGLPAKPIVFTEF